MEKYKQIKYNFSGEWEAVRSQLRKFSVNDVLKQINKESIDLLYNWSKAVKRVEVSLYQKGSTIFKRQGIFITAWTLIDLAYYLILASNDYIGKKIEKRAEIYFLSAVVNNYNEQKESDFLDQHNENEDYKFFMYLWGFVGEQIKMEMPTSIYNNSIRELYILFEINDSEAFNIEELVYTEVGLSWQEVIAFLIIAWYGFTNVNTLEELIHNVTWRNKEYGAQFEKLIKRYTADYDEIRKSPLRRQSLYAKPYIKTDKGEVISVSTYLSLFLCEHSILWIIRDKFKKNVSQEFTNYYGELFEQYFGELLGTYLSEGEYEKIPETKNERADWKLHIGEYKFLIEQKSTVLRLSAKQQQTDINAIEDFARKTVIKAISQLENTEKEFDEGKFIKIILLYDDYLNPHLLEKIMDMPECTIKNDNYFWIATINELEMLFSIAKTNRKLFDAIAAEKINREVSHSKNGRSFAQIMNEKGITQNDYINQGKFNEYKDEVRNTIDRLCEYVTKTQTI